MRLLPGREVGTLRIRLFQPFPAEQVMAALPPTVRAIAVLDRTKEPGSVGEPLYLAIVAGLAEAMDGDAPPFATAPRVIGGRYGLSSKEMTPSMIKPIFDALWPTRPKRHFTVGIYDDVTNLSLTRDGELHHPVRPTTCGRCFRSGKRRHGRREQDVDEDHRREHGPICPRILRLRLEEVGCGHRVALAVWPEPIRSTYLIEQADFVACHQFGRWAKTRVLESGRSGATFLLNAPTPRTRSGITCRPGAAVLSTSEIDFWVVDVLAVAERRGWAAASTP